MNIKRFNQIDEGVREFLKPKSHDDIVNSIKDKINLQCDNLIDFANKTKNHKYENIDNTELARLSRSIAKLEILNKITEDERYNFKYYDTYYINRMSELIKTLKIT